MMTSIRSTPSTLTDCCGSSPILKAAQSDVIRVRSCRSTARSPQPLPVGAGCCLDQRGADDDAVGDWPDRGGLLGAGDAEAHRDRAWRDGPGAGDEVAQVGREAVPGAGHAGQRDQVQEARGVRPRSSAAGPAVEVGAARKMSARPAAAQAASSVRRFLERQVRARSGRRRPPRPRRRHNARARRRGSGWRSPSARPAGATPRARSRRTRSMALRGGHAVVERDCVERWMTGPSASGSEKGTPSSIRSAPAWAIATRISSDVGEVGEAGGEVGHERGAALGPVRPQKRAAMRATPVSVVVHGHTGALPLERGQHRLQVLVPAAGQVDQQDLRPCPASARASTASAIACDDSSAGRMPSVRASSWNAASASSSFA